MKLTSPLVVSFFMKHQGPVYLLPRVACKKVRKKDGDPWRVDSKVARKQMTLYTMFTCHWL
jgi:hypothetical protein